MGDGGITTKEYKSFKGLRKESLRDNMSDIEVARRGGKIVGNTRKDLESEIGDSVVTSSNVLNYEYKEIVELEESSK